MKRLFYLIAIALLIQAPAAIATANVNEIRAAIQAQPDRPGLQIALATHLVLTGNLKEAKAISEAILKRWPRSTRAKALLRAIKQQHEKKTNTDSLNPVQDIQRMSSPIAKPKLTWQLKATAGLHHDSIASWDTTVSENQATPRDAWRSLVSADAKANFTTQQWRYQGFLGLDRTLHLDSLPIVHQRDRTLMSLRASAENSAILNHRFGIRADLKGALGGRPGSPHHFAGGLGGWWSTGTKQLSPFVEVRTWHFEFSPKAQTPIANRVLRLGEIALGAASQLNRFRLGIRTNAIWLEPYKVSGYTEVGTDLSLDYVYQPLILTIRSGLGYRSPGNNTNAASLRPRAAIELRVRLHKHISVLVESHWRRATGINDYLPGNHVDRWVSGIQVEFVQ